MTQTIGGRALWFEGPRQSAFRDELAPPPGPGEIRVRAIHSLISQGSEMNVYRGEGKMLEMPLDTIKGTLPFPVKFGYQLIGRVESAGEGSGFEAGDLVFATHPHQDVFTMPAAFGVKLPAAADPLRAMFTNMCNVALRTSHEAPVRVGECVVVTGLGVIGSLCAHLARKTAGRLIVVDPMAERREAAAWIGADAVIDPSELGKVVAEYTEGRGADMFIETSGATPALQSALDYSGDRGMVVVPAWHTSRNTPLALSPDFHLRALTVKSVFVASVGGDEAARWPLERRLGQALDIVSKIDVNQLISERIPFERATQAHSMIDSGAGRAPAIIIDY
ncbi:threonine dehydrogenase-like Zn-dependent dehydrogenase [Sphingobium xenophagum]|uniref:Threonine dehydrogenase-like Zn-dependent dehydrogenase n=1 Tax=Sphingobium xenophagum TaxID=121428 RepID=A0ABU1X6M6_SPHXE|nr:zinc-binding alcohol dehydrogenase [Sphingobium xenophagum]MDR7157236.1 threonine dehydrogenase-like Zn-dependent dehydrogenase [Sphingobium xenophagum]